LEFCAGEEKVKALSKKFLGFWTKKKNFFE
jgi:hypothetical protein